MTPDAWREVRRVLDGALALPHGERAAYVAGCDVSAEVRTEVEQLLALTSDNDLQPRPTVDPSSAGAPPTPSSLPPGTRVAHYRITRALGAGGMGAVYLAFDERLDREVALKVLKHQQDSRARAKLLREARAAAALDHPSICGVYEVGTAEGLGDFIVMQYVEGDTLAARLDAGPLRPRVAASLCRQLAEALVVAHAHGVVHRDIKPQNIVIDRSGRPRLLDFGIAQTMRRPLAEGGATTQVTAPGTVIGTPSYMSPEQVRGEKADPRSDLFSLGCVLYECLAGRRAFDGRTVEEICGQVLHVTPPAPSSLRPELTDDYDVLVWRLLEKEPGDRFQSAAEVTGAIRQLEGGTRDEDAVPVPSRRAWSRHLAIAAVAALVLSALLAFGGRLGLLTERLPPAPADAQHWYEQGLDALRSDSFAVALARLQEAVRIYPQYVEAHARMAEAHAALDDQSAAQQALLRVSDLLPNDAVLGRDDQLRLRAVRASVLRDHDRALAAHTELAQRHPDDSGVLVDLANAQDAAGRWAEARETLAKAVTADPQNPAAHLRLAVLQNRLGQRQEARASLDEAERLYHAAANVEGEAEALIRRASIDNDATALDDAQAALDRALSLTTDDRYVAQRLRAEFQQALIFSSRGRFSDAQELARRAADEASTRRLDTIAANGLYSLADALLTVGRFDDADAELTRAIELAQDRRAEQTAMRLRVQQAAIRLELGKPKEAMALVEAPLAFFKARGYAWLEAKANVVRASAHAHLREFDSAERLAADVLSFAEAVGDETVTADALEILAGLRVTQGRLPEALSHQARLSTIYRQQGNHYALPYALVNEAELLVLLGRGNEAEVRLAEVDDGIGQKRPTFLGRSRGVALVRALRAATEGRYTDVAAHCANVTGAGHPPGDPAAQMAKALLQLANAHTGRRLGPVDRAGVAESPEVAYWTAHALADAGRRPEAAALVRDAMTDSSLQDNPELLWRLGALMLMVDSGPEASADGRAARTRDALAELTGRWESDATGYLARADLRPLRALIEGEA